MKIKPMAVQRISFYELGVGDIFHDGLEYFCKSEEELTNQKGDAITAFRLRDGRPAFFNADHKVIPVHGEFVEQPASGG